MDKVKCECGHMNPYGTYLCESCGIPLQKEEGQLANMRYEGVARRSQTYNKSVVDKIWNFFSSVKVGIWIIVILLLASSIGTIFPQEMYLPRGESASTYYQNEYGAFGQLYYQLGFHNLYSSWWYTLILAALGISLVIASLDRVVPLYRALKTQRVDRHEKFLERQRLFTRFEIGEKLDENRESIEKKLKEKRYSIRKKDQSLLAEKNRFARWGPYINHIGLIIFLIGGLLRLFPEMYLDDYIWVREGETEVVRGTDGEFFLRNDQFLVELYDEDDPVFGEALQTVSDPVVKTYQTSATLFERSDDGAIGSDTELDEVKTYDIRVNDPLTFDSFSLYQVDYKLNELSEFTFRIEGEDLDEEEESVTFNVDLNDPQMSYDLENGFRVEIVEYFPNFMLNEQNEPTTLNRIPDNPRIIFEVFPPDTEAEEGRGELSLIGVQVNEALNGENDYRIAMTDVDMVNVTGLTVRRDRTLPILILGGAIFMVGLVQGSYWHHRRIWLREKDGELLIAGHANKNWHSLKKDFEYVLKDTGIPQPIDQADDQEAENSDERDGEQHGST
ncbi:cytochrome c biogenesis protein ResB [Salisediminibacterium beveridgei]|uniref:Cytochrome c-type biogenesis protein Ccs1/ResB n=1 Tax=Salisediminibacterium beveridgei TaxID=632773 RepID=A0A1D7QUT1_9BACI|nr:cytochrome c biogenesis protein ResB [Salisediminibacterium beveridgei]AOM82761.1 Cytochrome c-type biogenesis protein Ccs1/ResB [Salisediminibacterium beveridgei]